MDLIGIKGGLDLISASVCHITRFLKGKEHCHGSPCNASPSRILTEFEYGWLRSPRRLLWRNLQGRSVTTEGYLSREELGGRGPFLT
jgi:hypothetical protein